MKIQNNTGNNIDLRLYNFVQENKYEWRHSFLRYKIIVVEKADYVIQKYTAEFERILFTNVYEKNHDEDRFIKFLNTCK